MLRADMLRLQPGSLVQSSINFDRGSVVRREKMGVFVLWSTGIREFVLFSEPETLMRPRNVVVEPDPVRRRAMQRRQIIPARDDTPPDEQERILREIAELRAMPRPDDPKAGSPPRARMSYRRRAGRAVEA